MRVLAFSLVVLLFFSYLGPARSPQSPHPKISESGNGFLEVCRHVDDDYSAQHAGDAFTCLAWINGFVDGVQLSQAFHKESPEQGMFCLEENVTTLQLIHVVRKYIEDNPARAH